MDLVTSMSSNGNPVEKMFAISTDGKYHRKPQLDVAGRVTTKAQWMEVSNTKTERMRFKEPKKKRLLNHTDVEI